MISEVESLLAEIDLQTWRDLENCSESDSDSRFTGFVPALGRLLGWLNSGKNCEQVGMRVKAMLFCIRPDFLDNVSLGRMPPASKRIFDDLVADFKATFYWRQSAHQTNGNGEYRHLLPNDRNQATHQTNGNGDKL